MWGRDPMGESHTSQFCFQYRPLLHVWRSRVYLCWFTVVLCLSPSGRTGLQDAPVSPALCDFPHTSLSHPHSYCLHSAVVFYHHPPNMLSQFHKRKKNKKKKNKWSLLSWKSNILSSWIIYEPYHHCGCTVAIVGVMVTLVVEKKHSFPVAIGFYCFKCVINVSCIFYWLGFMNILWVNTWG